MFVAAAATDVSSKGRMSVFIVDFQKYCTLVLYGSFWQIHILMKIIFRLALLSIAPYVGLPNTRSLYFIWVDYIIYMQY